MKALVAAMEEGRVAARPAVVLSDDPTAPGLAWARDRGIPARSHPWPGSRRREEHDRSIVCSLREHGVDWICLAGYMRLVGGGFLRAFPGRVLNIHPALLPSFPGLHVQEAAARWGVRVTGATVHFVDEEMDHGPIIWQAPVPVFPGEDGEHVAERILRVEHRLYPLCLGWAVQGKLRVSGRSVLVDETPARLREWTLECWRWWE